LALILPKNKHNMKAGILHKRGEAPKYGDFSDPVPQNEGQLLVTVKAVAIKNLDKGKASGAHYSASTLQQPEVVGMDGVGTLPDGSRVYAFGITGMAAEKALVDKNGIIPIPAGLNDATAAALPNAVLGAAGALRFRAKIKPGETVLINGATGVTGMMAVQIAKHYGAKKIIVTGRNHESLEKLRVLGAHVTISLKQDDAQIITQVRELHANTPIDVVIDYIWGHPAELILASLQGKGHNTHPVRVVTVGGMAGDKIELSSSILRSSDIQISGSGLGSLPAAEMRILFSEILPEMLQLAADETLKIETVTAHLKDIETAWNQNVDAGKRLVILI